MNTPSTAQSFISRYTTLAALLIPALFVQAASAHEYDAQLKAKKFAEVERAIAAKLAQ